jgi:DNA-binding PucR family transcriptional regulator/putative methionine-R-sulfoxide reductase with GAF domain
LARPTVGRRGPDRTPAAVGGRAGRQTSTHSRLQTLQLVATEIVRSLDFDATLLSISNAAVEVLNADMVGIMSADDDRLKMITCAGHRHIAAARFEARRGEGVAGIVFETGSSFRLDDFRSAGSISPHIRDIAEKEGIRAALGAPMLANGRVIGAVLAWSSHPAAFAEEDEEVLAGLANLAAIAIQNARLYESAREAADRLELANKALRQQYDVLARATAMQTELTQLVLDGGGLPALVDMVARHTGGDVAVLYAGLEPLAVTADCDDAFVAQARAQIAAWRGNSRGRTGGAGVMICEVSSGEEPMAYLCVRLDRPPTELTQLITQQAAVVCALELTKQRAVLDARTQVRSDFLWDLLEGKIADVAEATLRARHLGHTLPLKLRVMLIDIGGLESWAHAAGGDADLVDRRRSALLADIERLAAQAGAARILSARRASALVLIIPGCSDVRGARKLATQLISGLAADAPELRFSAGVSTCHDLTADLSSALSQARTALASVTGTALRAALFDDLGVSRFLLAPGRRADLADFVRAVLGPVLDYDREHSTHLVETLSAYLAEDLNLGRTAKRLYCHAKTVRYRLDRSRDLTGRDLTSQRDCFDIQLALRMMEALDIARPATVPRSTP